MFVFDQLKKGDFHLQKLAVVIFLAMIMLLVRLWVVQVVSARKYTELHKDQSFRTVRIPAVRGKILDRNGVALAENRPNYSISLYLDELRKSFQAQYKTLSKAKIAAAGRKLTREETDALTLEARYTVVSNLASQLSGELRQPVSIDPKKFYRHYEQRRVLPFPVVEDLTPVQIARFQEQPLESPGVDLEVQPTRLYPYKQTAAHILGHLTRTDESIEGELAVFDYPIQDFRGDLGIEGFYNVPLHGYAGVKSVQVNRLGYRQNESIWTPAEPGKNVVLTIDLELQRAAEAALRSSTLGVDARAAAIVLNVSNGDILVMASNPTFDPNAYVNGLTREDMLHLHNEQLKPESNRTIHEIYPPGSIFKIISGLAALERGLDPNEMYASPGYYQIGNNPRIGDTAGSGDFDFKRAFAKSSNSYFIHHGIRIGAPSIFEMGNRFFLGQPTEIPTLQDQRGFFPTPQWVAQQRRNGVTWTDGDTANLCIGQGKIAVTPMQMAVMTAAIANGGHIYWPRLVQRIEPQEQLPNQMEVQEFPPRLRGELNVKPRNLQIVREAMLADTEEPEGSAFKAFHEEDRKTLRLKDLRICGKTGTAEIKKHSRNIVDDKITWFVSFAPYDRPRYAVVIMIESGGSGGGTCAPVAEKIYTQIEKMEKRGTARAASVAKL